MSVGAAACGLQTQSRAQTYETAMHTRLLRTAAAAALLVCFASGTLAAEAGTYRSAPAPGWSNATHRTGGRAPVRRVPSGQHLARGAWHSPNGPHGPSWATPPIQNLPGATVLSRQFLDDVDATTLRDALRYVPGVTVRR
jgi:outer membrane receptor for monomeric catechols